MNKGTGPNTGMARRVVLKFGSRTLTAGGPDLDTERLRQIVETVANADGIEPVIVSSGAVAAGYRTLGLPQPPDRIQDRQAAAAIGQTRLMAEWSKAFDQHGKSVGQILLTNDCLSDRRRWVTAGGALSTLLDRGVVPIVNENDTVSIDEIVVGDNDNLAAMTAALVRADLLVLLTDVDGVYRTNPTLNPESGPISFAQSADELREFCYAKQSAESRGGMETKLEAAEKAGRYGIPTVIASGSDPDVLRAILVGEARGTFVAGNQTPLAARRHWMVTQRPPAGAVVIDDGAVAAVRRRASLLPRGVVGVRGHFRKGDLVSLVDPRGTECARGLIRYDDREVDSIRGLHSTEVPSHMGIGANPVIMRPDRMVIMAEEAVS